MKKILSLTLILALCLLSLAGCGSSAGTPSSAPSSAPSSSPADSTEPPAGGDTQAPEKTFKVALSIDDISTDFANLLVNGCTAAAEEYGFDFEVRNAGQDPSTQTAQVENLVTLGYDAIILKPLDESACGAISDACEEAGIPLIVVSTVLPTYYTSSVAADNEECGRIRAEAMVEALGTEFNLAVVEGPLGSEGGNRQYQAAMDVFAKYEGIKIVVDDTANNKRDEAIDLVTTWLTGGKEFDAIWASNDASAIGAGLACEDFGLNMDDVYIVGNGCAYEACTYMESGILDASCRITGYTFGYESIVLANTILTGGSYEHDTFLPLEVITAGTDRFQEIYAIEKSLQANS